ncbi:MAG: hypothetical protein ABSD82_13630 [Solirubrobacteraceae bacterium]
MSKFCRHGTPVERCPICQADVEAAARKPVAARRPRSAGDTRPRSQLSSRGGLTVRREARSDDDGYRSPLAPGLRSTADARRLAQEIGFAAARLQALSGGERPGLYAEIAAQADGEQATWLALLTSLLGPLESDRPFSAIEDVATPWPDLPDLGAAEFGPRGSHEPGRLQEALAAYVRFAQRAGSQQLAFTGDLSWAPQQRFARIYERLALPGLHRRARYDLLVTLGRLGRHPLAAPGLLLTEEDAVTLAAKRVFAIGDRLTIERRARELAAAAQAPIDSLDLALESWARGERITQGFAGASLQGSVELAQAAAMAALAC